MRLHRAGAIGAMLLAVATIAAACSSGGGSSSTSTSTSATKASVASQLVMGGPPECPTRLTCLIGLTTIYNLHFKDFKALDEVGPISVAALLQNQVQVVRLDSSDPSILQNHWVILKDDKSYEQAGNIIPIIRTSKVNDEVKSLLNKVSSTMTQTDLLTLDTQVQVNHQDAADVANKYVTDKNLASTAGGTGKATITIGSAAFSENEMLADIYSAALKSAGYTVKTKLNLGNREIYEPALETGQIDLIAEYAGNYLSFLDKTIGSLPLSETVTRLQGLLTPKGLTALDPSNATDSDAIVVTKATADKYHLVAISDLGKST
jgi:glycine betaine/choline ABC-type transport system substrate-binding protein